MTLLLLLGNQPPYFRTLLNSARRLTDDGDFAIAVVAAHMAFEIATEQGFSRLLQARGIEPPLEEPLLAVLPDRTFMDTRTRRLWTALTDGDEIKSAKGWVAYQRSVEVRNEAIHAGKSVDQSEARAAVDSVDQVIAHVQAIVKRKTD